MDGWMLSAYIKRFGPPRNVVLLRSLGAYAIKYNLEFMRAIPFSWDYWDHLGLAPVWNGEAITKLFLTKYGVIYSDADILRDRLIKPESFPSNPLPVTPNNYYTKGITWGDQQPLTEEQVRAYTFAPCDDGTKALRFMSDLARRYHFQFYFILPPEYDVAWANGWQTKTVTDLLVYWSQFVDPTYVHITRTTPVTFQRDQIQDLVHLRPGGDHIMTETNVSSIVAIQNQLTANQAQPLTAQANLDKNSYKIGDKPVITLTINNQSQTDVKGSVSYLIRPTGTSDGEWVARSPAVSMTMPGNGKLDLKPELSVGKVDKAGTYDLVVFLRQDVGSLSNETSVEFPKKLEFK